MGGHLQFEQKSPAVFDGCAGLGFPVLCPLVVERVVCSCPFIIAQNDIFDELVVQTGESQRLDSGVLFFQTDLNINCLVQMTSLFYSRLCDATAHSIFMMLSIF